VEDSESILHAAEDVLGLLQKHGIDAVVIGAVALAAYTMSARPRILIWA